MLKLDLHTHPFEAMGFPKPSYDAVEHVVMAVKRRGLDGIAITEHDNPRYGLEAAKIAKEYFPEVLIIPGCEVQLGGVGPSYHRQVVELYLECGVFRFMAHPYDYRPEILASCHGIEVENALHSSMNTSLAQELAEKLELIALRNSDAHRLQDIGLLYNEIELELLEEAVLKKRLPSKTTI